MLRLFSRGSSPWGSVPSSVCCKCVAAAGGALHASCVCREMRDARVTAAPCIRKLFTTSARPVQHSGAAAASAAVVVVEKRSNTLVQKSAVGSACIPIVEAGKTTPLVAVRTCCCHKRNFHAISRSRFLSMVKRAYKRLLIMLPFLFFHTWTSSEYLFASGSPPPSSRTTCAAAIVSPRCGEGQQHTGAFASLLRCAHIASATPVALNMRENRTATLTRRLENNPIVSTASGGESLGHEAAAAFITSTGASSAPRIGASSHHIATAGPSGVTTLLSSALAGSAPHAAAVPVAASNTKRRAQAFSQLEPAQVTRSTEALFDRPQLLPPLQGCPIDDSVLNANYKQTGRHLQVSANAAADTTMFSTASSSSAVAAATPSSSPKRVSVHRAFDNADTNTRNMQTSSHLSYISFSLFPAEKGRMGVSLASTSSFPSFVSSPSTIRCLSSTAASALPTAAVAAPTSADGAASSSAASATAAGDNAGSESSESIVGTGGSARSILLTEGEGEEATGVGSSPLHHLVSPHVAQMLYEDMLLGRALEDACFRLYYQGKTAGFVHLYTGQEAVSSGVIKLLRQDDAVVSTYRDHVHACSKGVPAKEIMAELFGKSTGCSRGRGGSMHMFSKKVNMIGGFAFIGEQIPIALGYAFSAAYRRFSLVSPPLSHSSSPNPTTTTAATASAEASSLQSDTSGAAPISRAPATATGLTLPPQNDQVTVCFLGDGTTNIGQLWEALNIAALAKLPIIFVVENNNWAIGMAAQRSTAIPRVWQRAETFGVAGVEVDGMDVLAVRSVARRAIDRARRGEGPTLIEALTYRFRGHSVADPDEMRAPKQKEAWVVRDPILAFEEQLKLLGFANDDTIRQTRQKVDAVIKEAVQFAEKSAESPVEECGKYIFASAYSGGTEVENLSEEQMHAYAVALKEELDWKARVKAGDRTPRPSITQSFKTPTIID